MKPDDRTSRYRKLRGTNGAVFYHPCAECGEVNAPYGFGATRISRGEWIEERDYRGHKTGKKVWKGQPPIVRHGTWFCQTHRHLGEKLLAGVNSGFSSSSAPPSS